MKHSMVLILALTVAFIALAAVGAMIGLRFIHNDAVQSVAAEAVVNQGNRMLSRIVEIVENTEPHENAKIASEPISQFVHNLKTVENGLEYIAVTQDDMVLFQEQAHFSPTAPLMTELVDTRIRRALLQVADDEIPVVLFSTSARTTDGLPLTIEIALRQSAINQETRITDDVLTSMFTLSLVTVAIAFLACILLIGLMVRREQRHEQLRVEQEHLAFSGMLANGIVHDFRNPMSSLKLDLQMLARAIHDPDQHQRNEQLIARAIGTLQRMDDVFKAFLFNARPDKAGRTPTDLARCLQEALSILEPRLERNQITPKLSMPSQPLKANAFAFSLQRAISNILDNAVCFAPTGSTIDVRLTRNGQQAQIDIIDEGPGVDEANRDKIFDMFFSTRPEGSGLGLFLARAAIKRSGGTLALQPTNGSGAWFRISLPLII